ncbi:hypothetical protein HGRIS_001776 [Hohenbuehelia grisea]|uniref:CBM1 domain-containing protein n=1 Tax=Hohenbuehelia grisea TaxID=104357 RepID=A0ABR3JK67_9AGAR
MRYLNLDQALDMRRSLTFVVSAIVCAVSAQQPTWAQCGGIGWSGGTTCTPGNTCTKLNDYYFQCLPGAAPSSQPTTPPPSTSPTTSAGPVPTVTANWWFSFGDSYTQTGFNPSGALPSTGNPIGNPAYPGNTATGGQNWVGYDTTVFNKSLVLTYNYAYGGATIDAKLVPPFSSSVVSLTDQVNQFLNGAGKKPASSPWTSDNSLFSIWIGINDIGSTYSQSGDRAAFSDTLLNAEFALVQKLVSNDDIFFVFVTNMPPTVYLSDVGARNFLFVNVPPVDRSPLMISQGANAQSTEKTVILGFNSKLAAKIDAFKASHAGVQTWLWDSNAAFTTILNSPRTYGFNDATSVGTGSGNFWGDVYHPSSAAHKIFGQQVADVRAGTIW